jgi:hypothetical protein
MPQPASAPKRIARSLDPALSKLPVGSTRCALCVCRYGVHVTETELHVIFHGNRQANPALHAAFAFTLILAHGCGDPTGGNAGTSNDPQTSPGTSAGAGGAKPAASAGSTAAPTTGSNAAGSGTATSTPGGGTPSTSGGGGSSSAATAGSTAAPTAGTTSAATAGTASAAGAEAAAGAGGDSGAAGAVAAGDDAGKLPHVTMVEGAGLEDAVRGTFGPAVKVKDIPPGGWMIYPEDIGRDGIKHPIFLFGPGGGTNPQYYDMNGQHWDHYTSYGFVVFVAAMSSFTSTMSLDAGLTWLIEQNDDPESPLYQHLDTSKVGAAGHSQGSVMVFNFMPDERVTTTIHISGGSSGGSGPANLKSDTMFLCGPSSDVAYAQCETDFEATKVPTFYTNILESSHTTSGRYGWGSIVAWLLWHLAGHEEWRKEFLEPDGQFQTGRYTSKTKNF